MMVEDLTNDKATNDILNVVEGVIRGNEDLWNGVVGYDELVGIIIDGNFSAIERYDSLKEFIWESAIDLDLDSVGSGYVYDFIVDNDIYLYEIKDKMGNSNGIVAIYK